MAKAKKGKIKKSQKVEEVEAQVQEEIQQESSDKKNRQFQLYWILGAIVVLVVLFFISSYIFNSINTFEHEGITFTKEKFGEIPVFHYYYYITPQLKYNLYLRRDPRENKVSITGNAVDLGIELKKEEPIYLSVDPKELTQCEYGRAGIGSLATFLADNQFKVIGASSDEEIAKEAGVKYATCEFRPNSMVILLQAGNKTEIVYENERCYTINVANCEVLEAVEKFQVQTILDAKARRESSSYQTNQVEVIPV